MVSVLILTKNEQQDLPKCLKSLAWCDDIHLFDSYSTDRTVEIARAAGARVTQRVFDNWSSHQNWGVSNIPFKYPWVLYVDADESVSPELARSVVEYATPDSPYAALRLRRRDFFSDGTWLKHAQISPFYVRIFRPERIRYERLVNPVSVVAGAVGEVAGYLDHYPFSKGLGFWLERHVKYAALEAQTKINEGVPLSFGALFATDFDRRRRAQKALFYRLPFRPTLKWSYMMFVRRAFLDGAAGRRYAALQRIYESMIVAQEQALRSRTAKRTL